jgi:histidinol dehydrogenase
MLKTHVLATMSPAERRAICERQGFPYTKLVPEVRPIVSAVRDRGDEAVLEFTRKFDGVTLPSIEVPPEELAAADARVPMTTLVPLRAAKENIQRFHARDVVKGFEMEALKGVLLGKLAVPFDTVGLYVPGGKAAYPSSVLMGAVPAMLAGVKQIVLCTPPQKDGSVPPLVLAAAKLAGVRRVFRIGGAQAVAAMAYGTATVPACDMIVGPGNAYVTAAKQLVRDIVAVDFLAGPSEVAIVSDGTAPAKYIAAELIAQAEHDEHCVCLLFTASAEEPATVERELAAQLRGHPREEIARQALERNGAAVVCDGIPKAVELANDFAAEHLVLMVRHPKDILRDVKNAGSIFLGEHAPVAVGDYCAGPNHILPTLGWAKFAAALSASMFVRAIPYQYLSREGLALLAPNATTLARAEGLEGHARSIEIRLK